MNITNKDRNTKNKDKREQRNTVFKRFTQVFNETMRNK